MPEQPDKPNTVIRAVVDFGGLVVFVLAYFAAKLVLHRSSQDVLLIATWGLVVGSAVALLVGFLAERRLAPLPLFSGLAALIFGALALIFHNTLFVKIKPTAINLILSMVMLVGAGLGKTPLKMVLGGTLTMTDGAWRRLTVRYGVFFLVMAGLNEVVWRTQPDSIWILFRFPGLPLLSVLFALSQVPMMMKDMKGVETAAELES